MNLIILRLRYRVPGICSKEMTQWLWSTYDDYKLNHLYEHTANVRVYIQQHTVPYHIAILSQYYNILPPVCIISIFSIVALSQNFLCFLFSFISFLAQARVDPVYVNGNDKPVTENWLGQLRVCMINSCQQQKSFPHTWSRNRSSCH